MKNILDSLKSPDGTFDKTSKFYVDLKNDFTFHSSAIEGSQISKMDNLKLITDPKSKSHLFNQYPRKHVIENENLIHAFDYIMDTYNELLTIKYVKLLHKKLCWNSPDLNERDELAGEFRQHDVQVDTHLGARPSYISTLMKKLLEETPKKMTINDVAKFHCEYEIIHPFYDGNGRTGRLLMLKHCLQNNIQPFYIEEFNKKEYYLGIEYYQTTNRIDVITKYFINQQNRFFEKYSSKTKEYVV